MSNYRKNPVEYVQDICLKFSEYKNIIETNYPTLEEMQFALENYNQKDFCEYATGILVRIPIFVSRVNTAPPPPKPQTIRDNDQVKLTDY